MGNLAKVRRIQVRDYALQTIQTNLADAIDKISAIPLLSGNLFTDLEATGGDDLYINHGLGRKYRGYIVTRVQGTNPVTVRESLTQTNPETTLILVLSESGKIDVWVF